eukprot:TRINITY_DN2574_c0_g1_i2.p1 TRINITY_DN2574_c0_g1~~TRINITY_DN2574_c0_g1_i2.p1  ORF type:complete len:837 (-),score=193.64 TRINITY_DN2574_c0_g1_i2:1416-3926(-)
MSGPDCLQSTLPVPLVAKLNLAALQNAPARPGALTERVGNAGGGVAGVVKRSTSAVGLVGVPMIVTSVASPAHAVPTPAQRAEILKEIITTERNYVYDLSVLVCLYLKPLQVDCDILSKEDIGCIFMNIEAIYRLSNEFLCKLEVAFPNLEQIEPDTRVGNIFLQIGHYLKMYSTYCSNYKSSVDHCTACSRSNPAFSQFLKDTHSNPKCRGLSLNDYLIKPVQRLCKYPLLFRELAKFTPKDHPDYNSVISTQELFQNVTEVTNKMSAHKEILEKLINFYTSIDGFNEDSFSSNLTRNMVKEEWLQVSCPKWTSECHVYLLTDLFVITKRIKKRTSRNGQRRVEHSAIKGQQKTEKPKFVQYLPLIVFRDQDDCSLQVVNLEDQLSFTIHFPVMVIKENWMEDLKKCSVKIEKENLPPEDVSKPEPKTDRKNHKKRPDILKHASRSKDLISLAIKEKIEAKEKEQRGLQPTDSSNLKVEEAKSRRLSRMRRHSSEIPTENTEPNPTDKEITKMEKPKDKKKSEKEEHKPTRSVSYQNLPPVDPSVAPVLATPKQNTVSALPTLFRKISSGAPTLNRSQTVKAAKSARKEPSRKSMEVVGTPQPRSPRSFLLSSSKHLASPSVALSVSSLVSTNPSVSEAEGDDLRHICEALSPVPPPLNSGPTPGLAYSLESMLEEIPMLPDGEERKVKGDGSLEGTESLDAMMSSFLQGAKIYEKKCSQKRTTKVLALLAEAGKKNSKAEIQNTSLRKSEAPSMKPLSTQKVSSQLSTERNYCSSCLTDIPLNTKEICLTHSNRHFHTTCFCCGHCCKSLLGAPFFEDETSLSLFCLQCVTKCK